MTKFFFDERFPTKIIATSPATVSKSGTTYTIGVDTNALPASNPLYMWKVRRQLKYQSAFTTVEATVPPNTDDPINIAFYGDGTSAYGDGISDLIKTATGWNDTQMQTFYTAAALLTRGTHKADL